jgi:8-oxo-dGTP pyrophosphatase MutT (NUDIX family)
MTGQVLFREHGSQVAALCWRAGSRGLEVLLITSRKSRRWILPKGWPEPELSMADNAAREAFEEAGVIGKIEAASIGIYHYLKERREGGGLPCNVEVFALAVTRQLDDWPEKKIRTLAWVPLNEAIAKVSEPGVRLILKRFHKNHATQKQGALGRTRV